MKQDLTHTKQKKKKLQAPPCFCFGPGYCLIWILAYVKMLAFHFRKHFSLAVFDEWK